jgi:hypothetical protein
MFRCVNDGVMTIKPGQTTGNAHVVWSEKSSFTLFPTSGRVYVWRTPKEAYNSECLVPTAKRGGGSSMMVWAAISWYSVGPITTFMTELLDRLGNQVRPMIPTLFPTMMQFSKTTEPHSHSWNCSVMIRSKSL